MAYRLVDIDVPEPNLVRAIAQHQDARNRVAAVRSSHKEASLQRLASGDGTASEHDLQPGSW
jgi:hypothetical protein